MKLKVLYILILFFFFSGLLESKNYIETRYGWGDENLERYSFTYFTGISSNIITGFEYSSYNLDKFERTQSYKLPVTYLYYYNVYGVTPFYYPEKNNSKAKGVKLYYSLISPKNPEYITTYTFSYAYRRQDLNSTRYYDNIVGLQIEQNFYGEFFIMVKGYLNSYFDRITQNTRMFGEIYDMVNLNSIHFFNDTFYSNYGIEFARSFKPDYDSLIYFSFDRVNAYRKDYNSYLLGLKIFLNEERFSFNMAYNFIDFKNGSNEDFYRLGLEVNF